MNNDSIISEQDVFTFLLQFKDYAIVIVNVANKICVWNKGAENLFGYNSSEMIGQSIETLYADKQALQDYQYHIDQSDLNGSSKYDRWQTKKDNTNFFANIIIKPLYNANGAIKGYVQILRDTTSIKKLEEENAVLKENLEEKVRQRTRELEVVNKELEAFSYSVSHDLRSPLRAVSGYSMMLKEDYETQLDGEANRLINNIISNTKMMGQLIDDLLTFSKMSRMEVVNRSIDMKKLAENCCADLVQNDTQSLAQINVGNLPRCNGDSSMLKQVWYNLISNAIKYSSKKEKPVIEIGATVEKSVYTYFVKDNGEGFDMRYANKLFGVFQRLHRQDEFEGTGVGLALAKRIVTKHGGEIWGEAAVGKGATFYFTIPKNITDAK